jgi:hypothetical protein
MSVYLGPTDDGYDRASANHPFYVNNAESDSSSDQSYLETEIRVDIGRWFSSNPVPGLATSQSVSFLKRTECINLGSAVLDTSHSTSTTCLHDCMFLVLHKSKEKMVIAVFNAAKVSVLGSEESTFFWTLMVSAADVILL